MLRASNSLIGMINFLTFLISVPILGGGIWLSTKANSTDCLRFLQWPIIIIGIAVMVVSLAGFAGSCYRITWLLRLYLTAMFFIVVALIGFTIFAFSVTAKGSGNPVLNRRYLEYRLQDYSGWLKDRVSEPSYWDKIVSCIQQAGVCGKMAPGGIPETADRFYARSLTPIQSGCCKPPAACGFVYVTETTWEPVAGLAVADTDCVNWSNDQARLCYSCDSCKAGVLANLKKDWRRVSLINMILLIVMVVLYVIACAAFRNSKRTDNRESYGRNRMEKAEPSRFNF
ncbi:tetraspanin-3-like [Nymphaea colorata]|nr:tetraspanin-3-like [Nymphaea colorata]